MKNRVYFDELMGLSRKFYVEEGTRKPEHYFSVYADKIGELKNDSFDLLELGVYSGASVLIWREFFPNANIVGLDIVAAPERLSDCSISFVRGDQSSPSSLSECASKSRSGTFDVIIDDASHVGHLSKASFDYLFNKMLKNGGMYFIEDYGTGYSADFFDGGKAERSRVSENKRFPSHDFGMVGWVKQLIDDMHGHAIYDDVSDLPLIESIQLWNSIALVKKSGP